MAPPRPLLALCVAAALAAPARAEIVIAGDGWGSQGDEAFRAMLTANGHGTQQVTNIAIAESTAAEWVKLHQGTLKDSITKDTTHVWLTAGGTDCIQGPLEVCALTGGSADDCVDKQAVRVEGHMSTLIEAIHSAGPKVRVFGFGYDVFGMDNQPVCPAAGRALLPQCTRNDSGYASYEVCFNTQMTKMQATWARLAQKYAYVDTVDMFGTIQAAGGNKKASPGHPDLTSFAPVAMYQGTCIYPTKGAGGGFEAVFHAQWGMYWKDALGPAPTPAPRAPATPAPQPRPTPAPPAPRTPPPQPPATPPPAPGGCPGGSLSACIALCPTTPPAVFSACVKVCGTECPQRAA